MLDNSFEAKEVSKSNTSVDQEIMLKVGNPTVIEEKPFEEEESNIFATINKSEKTSPENNICQNKNLSPSNLSFENSK